MIASAFLAGFSACGGGASSLPISQTTVARQQSPVAQEPTPGAGGAADSVLRFAQGRWVGSCHTDDFHSPFKVAITFSGLELTQEISLYQDSGCQQLLSTWSRRLSVLSVHSFEPDQGSDVDGFDLESQAQSVTMTTFGGYGSIAGELCGLSSWTDGVPRDVSGLDCGAGRLETTGTDSVLYLQHDPDKDELLYENETLRRQ